jgi:hypothetical protein
VGWETTTAGTYSVTSISHSTKSPSRRSAVATDPPVAKMAKRTPKATKGNGSSHSVDADDSGDKYDEEENNVCLNNLGDYIVFQSKCFHQGYFNSESDMVYVTAQLFAQPSIAPVLCDLLTHSHTKELDFIQINLNDETVAALSNDILQNWNTTYSLERFGPCKNFDGPVDKDSNRQIPHTKFHEAPLLNKLVDTFTEMLQ